jgi:hypothetical protein
MEDYAPIQSRDICELWTEDKELTCMLTVHTDWRLHVAQGLS